MTPHTHSDFVPGCFRCELNQDELGSVDLCPACGEECDRDEDVCQCPAGCPIPAAWSNR